MGVFKKSVLKPVLHPTHGYIDNIVEGRIKREPSVFCLFFD